MFDPLNPLAGFIKNVYKPSALILESENRCNANCKWCYQKEDRNKKNLSLKEIKEVFKQAREARFSSVVLTGGEPTFSKKRFRDIVDMARERRFSVYLFTNALYARTVEIAKEYQKDLEEIQISVNAELHKFLEKDKIPHLRRVANALIAAKEEKLSNRQIKSVIVEEDDKKLVYQNLVEELEYVRKEEIAKGVDDFKKFEFYMRPEHFYILISKIPTGFFGSSNAYPFAWWYKLPKHDKFAGDITPCQMSGAGCEDVLDYSIHGIHPCNTTYGTGVQLMTREEVVDCLKKGENVIKKAVEIGNSKEWIERYRNDDWSCNDCLELSKAKHSS